MLSRYTRSPQLKLAVFWALVYGVAFAVTFGAMAMELSAILFAFFAGALSGTAMYVAFVLRNRRDKTEPGVAEPVPEAIERRQAVRTAIILPICSFTGLLIALLVSKNGVYGFAAGGSVGLAISYLLWRFGGPGDPKRRNRGDPQC